VLGGMHADTSQLCEAILGPWQRSRMNLDVFRGIWRHLVRKMCPEIAIRLQPGRECRGNQAAFFMKLNFAGSALALTSHLESTYAAAIGL
jgi:hypothetical protein